MLRNHDNAPTKKDPPDQELLIRIGASKIRQGKHMFQVTERNLKHLCSKTVDTEFVTIYKAPTKDEDVAGTRVRRKWMRRKLKKFEDGQNKLRRKEYTTWRDKSTNECAVFYEEEHRLRRMCNRSRGIYKVRYTPPPMGEFPIDGEGRRMLMQRKVCRYIAHLIRLEYMRRNIPPIRKSGRSSNYMNLLINPTMYQYLPEPTTEAGWRWFETCKSLCTQVNDYESIHGRYQRTDPFSCYIR